MKVFVSGGNGFLGQHIVKLLKKKGLNCVSVSLRDGYDFRDYQKTLELYKKERFDVVINCAAYVGGIQFGIKHMGEIYYNNTLMSLNLIEAARVTQVKHFINPISNCAYPARLTKDFQEEQFWDGPLHESVRTYGFVRKASWVHLWSLKQQYGFESTNFILPNMYGTGDHFDEERSHALGALIMKIVEAKEQKIPKVVIWGSGKPIREWLYVEDGAEVLVKAIDHKPEIGPINVGIGKGISINDMAYLIKDVVGYEGEFVFDTSKPDGQIYKTMDNKKLKELYNWTPPTSLKEGIKKTVEWYIKNRLKSK